ncbi:MAG: carbohydrate esterase [Candidatus Riflebacteria bacterium]|nr:carbohydrate esterase [Candidatus Riflebacteria bacterium]
MRHNTIGGFVKLWLLCVLMLAAGTATAANCNLVVSVPATTPDNAQICITGNHDLLGNWDGKGASLKEIGPNLFLFSADLPIGSEFEYKFTRGNFNSVEKTAQGLEIPNRKIRISAGASLNERLNVEAWSDQITSPATKPVITGNYQIIKAVKSQFLKPERDVIVWLPASYAKSNRKRYPVIYMHDGRNLFDATTAFGGSEWGVDEVMTEGIGSGEFREGIIVGIDNTSDRMSEYTPFPDPKHSGGDGDNYVRFIVEELKPLIDKKFRTLPDTDSTFIGGSSLGGLISLYAGISHPQTFGGVIAMSPSIWWADGKIIDWLISNNIADYKGRIWVDMGTREGEEAIAFTQKLAKEIASQAPAFKSMRYREFSGGTHSEQSWRQRLHLPLRFILSPERK